MPTPSGHRETPAPISAPIAAFLGPVALLCLIWALGCGGNTAAIGVVLPLSGPYSPYGRSLLNGMEAAVEGINETGGIGGRFLKLDVRDGAADPSKSSASLEELFLDSEILAAVGGLTPQTARAMEHVAVRHGKVLLSPAPIEAASSPEGPFLPFWPTAETRAEFAADYAAFTLHASDVLAVGFDEPGSRLRIEAFENRFSNADRKMKSLLVQREEVEGGTWAGDLRRSASGTQVFYLAADGPDLQLLMETLSIGRLKRPMLCAGSLEAAVLLDRAGPLFEGLLASRPRRMMHSLGADLALFPEEYSDRYGEEPDGYACFGYDAVRVLSWALAEGGASHESIRELLPELRSFPSLFGKISHSDAGLTRPPLEMCVVLDGRVLPLNRDREEALASLQARVESLRFGK